MIDRVLASIPADPLHKLLGEDSPYRGLIMAMAALIVLLYVNQVIRKGFKKYLRENAHKQENAEAFLRIYGTVYKILMAIAVISAASGSFKLLGLTIGFIGTMLGWSLQVPIRGIAAWAMVILKRPFRIGDRITVAGVTGDVLDIHLNHILLNQVGGTVQGEERSGRGILVPNAMLFGSEIINYNYFAENETQSESPTSKFMLDEVLVRLTFGSDFDYAKKLCTDAAKQAMAELIGETDEESFTRCEFLAWGILIRVRYKTIPAKRQEVSSRVTELIWQSFQAYPDRLTFAVGTNVVGLEVHPGQEPPPTMRSAFAGA